MKKSACFYGMALLLTAGVAWAEPVGTVLDWWRPDPSWPVPDGYQICDGSVVTDTKSPLFNMALPDLRDKFIMGVVDPAGIGASGGSATHSHSQDINHDHGSFTTNTAGDHFHLVDAPSYSATADTAYSGSHNHPWLDFRLQPDGKKVFITYGPEEGHTGDITTYWDNGIGNDGSGYYPFTPMTGYLTFYTQWNGDHKHSVGFSHDHSAFNSGTAAAHMHNFSVPALGTSVRDASSAENIPPYYGLLKIMRIAEKTK